MSPKSHKQYHKCESLSCTSRSTSTSVTIYLLPPWLKTTVNNATLLSHITHILKHYIFVHVQILVANVERALEIYKKYTQGTKESSTPASVIKQYSVSDDPIIVIMDYLATPMRAAYLVTPNLGIVSNLRWSTPQKIEHGQLSRMDASNFVRILPFWSGIGQTTKVTIQMVMVRFYITSVS